MHPLRGGQRPHRHPAAGGEGRGLRQEDVPELLEHGALEGRGVLRDHQQAAHGPDSLQNAIISYCYERNGLKLSVIPSVSEIYANRFVRFVRDGNDFSKINTASLVGVLRLSFDQEQLKTYFRSFYPVLSLSNPRYLDSPQDP